MTINRRYRRADLIVSPVATLVILGVILGIVVLSLVA